MNLNTARVFVDDIETAKGFYSQALGLPLVADGADAGYCVFDAGATTLVVETAEAEDLQLVGRFTGLSFDVADIEATYRLLTGRGVTFDGAPEPQGWGGVLATLRDPSGNQYQICQHPTD